MTVLTLEKNNHNIKTSLFYCLILDNKILLARELIV